MNRKKGTVSAILVGIFLVAGGLVPATPISAQETEQQGDDEYSITIMRTWNETELLVAIAPTAPYYDQWTGPGLQDSHLVQQTVRAAETWQTTIDDHGSNDISGNVQLDVRVIPFDDLGPSEFAEIDILVLNQRMYGPTPFLGFSVMQGEPCIMGNTPDNRDPGLTYRIALHEFGHCLGLGHTHDNEPQEDVMSHGSGSCVSNLNLAGVHEAFAPAFDRTPNSPVHVDKGDYEDYC